MCSHYKIPQSLAAIREFFGVSKGGSTDEGEEPEGEELKDARPTDLVPVILRHPKTGEKILRKMRLGLRPPWMREDSKASTFNARAETLAELPAFTEAYRERRCILPMPLFHEYSKGQRYTITLADNSLMGVAGLWEVRPGPDGPLFTCALITCQPNALVAQYHNRMPAILPPEDWDEWLNPALREPSALDRFLRPYPEELMSAGNDDSHQRKGKLPRHQDENNQPPLFD